MHLAYNSNCICKQIMYVTCLLLMFKLKFNSTSR